MMERDGAFTWEENDLLGGIRQDSTESIRRYRKIQNLQLFNEGAITKDLGLRQLSGTTIGSSTLDTLAGYDCHFNDETQILAVIQEGASNADLWTYDNNTKTFSAQSRTIANDVRVDMIMFADKLHILDGVTLQTMTSGKTWATPGDATYSNPCFFGAVYANRLIIAGNATYPYSFFPSGLRDSGTWDASLAVDVTGAQGEQITALGTMGQFLIVGGRTFTRAYYLGTASPRDWDWDEISALTGPAHHASFVSIPSTHGQSGRNVAFFWSVDGPMMLIQEGEGIPKMVSLVPPIVKAVRGLDHQDLDGLAVDRYSDVQGVYVPEYDEVRFSVTKKTTFAGGVSKHDECYCLNLTSALRSAQGQQGAYPYWRVRNNTNKSLPVQTIFQARMHPDSHLPSNVGVVRCLCAQDGYVYEMDSRAQYKDSIEGTEYSISMLARRDGYDGVEDGVRNHTKSARQVYARTTLVGNYDLFIKLVADGGAREKSKSVDLSGDLNEWGDSRDWGDGTLWNAGDFVNARATPAVLGKKFDIEFYDNGNIEGEFQMNSFSILGFVEDRR